MDPDVKDGMYIVVGVVSASMCRRQGYLSDRIYLCICMYGALLVDCSAPGSSPHRKS